MANLKITAAQIIALRSATMRDNGSYELTTAKGQTVNALTRSGILVSGTRFLTVQGVSVMHAVSHVSVIASKGHTTYVSDSPESLEMFTLPERESETVEIQGDEPANWTPDFLSQGARECYFACGSDVVAVWVTDEGRTEGVCEAHRDRVERPTHELPVAHTVAPQILAHARQSMGKDVLTGERVDNSAAMAELMDSMEADSMTDNTSDAHVLIPGTHALDMGTRGYNRFVGIGESQGVPGSLFTFGLATAISAHPGMNGTGKTNIPCEYGDVITVRTSLGDVRYVVEDNRYSATGPRKGDPILTPYATDTQRCARCETFGDNSMPSAVIHGDYVCGYCVENTESDESDRFPCFKRMGTVTHKGECAQAHGVNGAVCSLEDDETEDAGFVETDSVDDYAIVARLTTSAGFNTVADSPRETGTTHHSMDAHGGQWERFEHVLSVGDIVRSTETGRALYEVYALIPGLPVVYVDPCNGSEPFPMGATKLYAL